MENPNLLFIRQCFDVLYVFDYKALFIKYLIYYGAF